MVSRTFFKSYPAITTIKSAWGKWGYFELSELLEVVNNVRTITWEKKPITSQQLFDRFLGMNTFLKPSLSGEPRSRENRILIYWVYRENTWMDWLGKDGSVIKPRDRENPLIEPKIYVPAEWGKRVIDAVKRGGERADRIRTGLEDKFFSEVFCHQGRQSFIVS